MEKAEKLLKQALTADIGYGPAHNNLGKVYYHRQNFYLAAWEFEYAILGSKDAGLPCSEVRGLTQAADGSLWIAGRAGLAHFDGRSFTLFDEQDGTPAMCEAVAIDHNGIVWVGNQMGLYRYDGESFVRRSDRAPSDCRPRQVPLFNPPITNRKVKPDIQKTTKGIGGQVGKIDSDANTNNMTTDLWKKILDTQLRRNVKEPRY